MSSMPVMDGHDDPNPGRSDKHPENRYRCKPCGESQHDSCRGDTAGGIKCKCECREPARTKRHDWLDSRFDDEIEIERALGHAPGERLVFLTELRLSQEHLSDVPWFFLGRYKTSLQRMAHVDARWAVTCRRCQKPPKVKTIKIVVEARASVKVDWLKDAKDVLTAERPERTYRVGQCKACRTMFWFELLEGS